MVLFGARQTLGANCASPAGCGVRALTAWGCGGGGGRPPVQGSGLRNCGGAGEGSSIWKGGFRDSLIQELLPSWVLKAEYGFPSGRCSRRSSCVQDGESTLDAGHVEGRRGWCCRLSRASCSRRGSWEGASRVGRGGQDSVVLVLAPASSPALSPSLHFQKLP